MALSLFPLKLYSSTLSHKIEVLFFGPTFIQKYIQYIWKRNRIGISCSPHSILNRNRCVWTAHDTWPGMFRSVALTVNISDVWSDIFLYPGTKNNLKNKNWPKVGSVAQTKIIQVISVTKTKLPKGTLNLESSRTITNWTACTCLCWIGQKNVIWSSLKSQKYSNMIISHIIQCFYWRSTRF